MGILADVVSAGAATFLGGLAGLSGLAGGSLVITNAVLSRIIANSVGVCVTAYLTINGNFWFTDRQFLGWKIKSRCPGQNRST